MRVFKLIILLILLVLLGDRIRDHFIIKHEITTEKYNQSYRNIYFKLFSNDSPFTKEEQIQIKQYKKIFSILRNTFNTYHVYPKDASSKLEKDFIDSFITELDPSNFYFTKADIIALKNSHPIKLVNQTDAILLFLHTYQIYTERLIQYKKEIENFHYTNQKDIISQDRCENIVTLVKKWNVYLNRSISLLKVRKESHNNINNNILFLEKEIKKNELLDLEEDHRTATQEIFSKIISGYLKVYDPHSNYYMDNKKLSSFASNQSFGFGFYFTTSEPFVITDIVPESPSEKAGLKESDQILSIKNNLTSQSINLKSASFNEISQFIDQIKSSMSLTILRSGSLIKTITIKRNQYKVKSDSLSLNIIKTTQKKSIGYIQIPLFYTDLQSHNINNDVSIDFEKAIQVLNLKKISNLIIDLRNNSGGSFDACIKMLSHFITDGPLIQIKNNKNEITISRPMPTKTIYKGNVVILINENSASASEIFAATMQDYNKAIIIGTNSSYGKGSVQSIIDFSDMNQFLDNTAEAQYDPSLLGFLQITIQQIYRVSGKSTQSIGITPDLLFYLKTPKSTYQKESQLPNALPYNEIAKLEFKPFALKNKVKIVETINKAYRNEPFIKNSIDLFREFEKVKSLNSASDYQSLKQLDTISKDLSLKMQEIAYKPKNFIEKDVKKTDLYQSFLIDISISTLNEMDHE